MTQHQNIPPTLQALIDGWRASLGFEQVHAVFRRGCADALAHELQAHPVVPLGELKAAFADESVIGLIDRYEPQPPNPHPPGTYLWAREEHARGRDVRVPSWNRNVTAQRDCPWESFRFNHCDFTATDWEVVS